jgi:flagellar biosynthetic protein FlhB
MASGVALGEVVKALVKVGVIGFVLYRVVMDRAPELGGLFFTPVGQGASSLALLGLEMGIKGGGAFLVLASLDYLWQRRRYEVSLRMTRQELKEELKQTEGDPRLKARIRQVQRQWASRRMMHAVPQADVVITNPVHYAVALRYKAETMRAPQLVAKGRDLLAERIKELARQHGIPVVQNPPLAQALYRSVEVGMEIPAALYQAVAEVLAYVYRLRGRHGR